MTDVLGRIDAALDGLCPCGGQPRDGSAYCGDDCVPNYHGIHTISDNDGTQMRWRPDLVAAADDSHRIPLGPPFHRGRFTAQTFEYADNDRLHLRLDDGHRFVGLDVDGFHVANDEFAATWERLERELTDTRHINPADVPRQSQIRVSDLRLVGFISPAQAEHFRQVIMTAAQPMSTALRQAFEVAAPAFRRFARIAEEAGHSSSVEPEHPLVRMNARRRDVSYGPERPVRPPRQLGPGSR